MPDSTLETDLQAINTVNIDKHLDDTIEQYLTWLGEQNIEALRKHTDVKIAEFEKESDKGRAAITKRIQQLSK